MRPRGSLIASFVPLILVSLVATSGPVPDAEMRGRALVAEAIATEMPTAFCSTCWSCGDNKHQLVENGPWAIYGDVHSCAGGHDCSWHSEVCGGLTAELTGKLWAAIQSATAAQLQDILAAYPVLEYVAERNALQLRGCTSIVAHYPLTNERVASRLALATQTGTDLR